MSRGQSLNVEVTSVAMLMWLYEPDKYWKNIDAAAQWLSSQCNGGRFGSTQVRL